MRHDCPVCSIHAYITNYPLRACRTIMDQVKTATEGMTFVELTFSEAGDASSEMFANMSISVSARLLAPCWQTQNQARERV